ncbi:MAG: hypothetical protein LKM36_02180 [Flavobacteriales bacterium]|jgi:FtsZ-binding cell division protein ZapB|nr:hypothetical protein [Flavobacteriales bacterium]MBP9160895.1 hypothetical protein [Flavobacteriales bacterium]MCI1751697.1 hypothetical protein [Flavobacteriales bacterium]
METNDPQPAKTRSNTLLLALVVLLLISNVVLLYLWSQQKNQATTSAAQVTTVTSEKENVTKLLEDMLVQYDTLSTTNTQLKTEMDAQREQIASLMDKVKRGTYDVSKAKKEAETLRKIMKGYVVTIDSLNQVNQALMAENVDTKQQLGEVTGQKQALESKTAEQQEVIRKGSVLNATGISAGALFLRNSGKQVDTDRGSKAEMVKCCFGLAENRITPSGNKTLYMRIIGPDGTVLPSADPSNRFQYEGVEGEFSVKRDVNYQNQPVDVCMFWTANGKMAGGEYKVDVYESGMAVGHTTFNLK